MGELIVIAIVALLFLGPEKLPEAAKTLSRGIRDFRKQTRELQETLEGDNEIGGALRDLKSALRGDELPSVLREQQRLVQEAAHNALGTGVIGPGRELPQGSAEDDHASGHDRGGRHEPGEGHELEGNAVASPALDGAPVIRPSVGSVPVQSHADVSARSTAAADSSHGVPETKPDAATGSASEAPASSTEHTAGDALDSSDKHHG